MVKKVLAYGDSLTWGFNPVNCSRYASTNRWPHALEQELDGAIEVIEEALCGRTTCYDDKTSFEIRNGSAVLPTILGSHQPLDLVILMLGTNDLKSIVTGSAVAAALGMKKLIQIIRSYPYLKEQDRPEIIIVSPPYLVETFHPLGAELFRESIAQSKKVSLFYSDLADELECAFFDAASVAVASPVDGVHLDENNTKAIGKGLAPLVRMVLGL